MLGIAPFAAGPAALAHTAAHFSSLFLVTLNLIVPVRLLGAKLPCKP